MDLLGLENISAQRTSSPEPRAQRPPALLVELEPWGRSFFRNLGDLVFRRRLAPFVSTSIPAPFWPDVFVTQRPAWGAFAESLLYHGVLFGVAWGISVLMPERPQIAQQQRKFDSSDVIYFSPSEYLPPLDTGSARPAPPRKGEPEFAKQQILSVPPEADNRRQTIVTPPDVKLKQDVPTPNIVAWGNRTVPVPIAATERHPNPLPALPSQVVAPAPEVSQANNRNVASQWQSIVAPPPDLQRGPVRAMASMSIDVVAPIPDATGTRSARALNAPQSSVVEPPPMVNAASVRKLGDMNIGRSDVIAPAPQLAVPAQRTAPSIGGTGKGVVPPPPSLDAASGTAGTRTGGVRSGMGQASSSQVVPPPPSVQGARSSEGNGQLIALGIHPSVAPPPDPIVGNRRGTFAATPEGRPGAAGTPDIRNNVSSDTSGRGLTGNGKSGNGSGGTATASGVPPGILVGAPARPPTSAVDGDPVSGGNGGVAGQPGRTIASSSPPPNPARAAGSPSRGPKATLVDNPTPLEQQIFSGRALYSMTLNMPNLNSAGGSWVIRFAELKSSDDSEGANKGELIAPVAEHKVDPAYPMELMRDNVSGTVILRAIIHADGTVGSIKVENGPDIRLERYAADALSHWHFLPAMKNGVNVDVEAIVIIPFKPILRRSF